MSSKLQVANKALLLVGARTQVSSIEPSDGSTEANAITTLFQSTFETLARSAPWNCLRKQKTLSLLAAAQGTTENPDGTTLPLPSIPWNYAYAYPSDCLNFQYLVSDTTTAGINSTPQTTVTNSSGSWFSSDAQIPYDIATFSDVNDNIVKVILTNLSQAQGVYTANYNNPSLWDSLFESAMTASLAALLVPALSLSIPLMQVNMKVADEAIAIAQAKDGNEGVTVMDHVPDWITARGGFDMSQVGQLGRVLR